jgi:hypothetical protein
MSTTSAYGWNIPDNTDLVKDGALAIRTLGNAIDTSMNTALGTKKAGMVLLNTTSFSGVASQSINDVFSATYDSYKILVQVKSDTGSPDLTLRLRVSGTDASGANTYLYHRDGSLTTTSIDGDFSTTSFLMGSIDDNAQYPAEAIITRPFIAAQTGFHSLGGRYQVATNVFGFHNQSTSYTGFTLLAANNITGTVLTYGFNK